MQIITLKALEQLITESQVVIEFILRPIATDVIVWQSSLSPSLVSCQWTLPHTMPASIPVSWPK
jgi:hypothetical protein